jgi:hypothetical protein
MPSELLRPISWTDQWRYGLASNVDEPFDTPDGSTIGEDRAGGHTARFQMSDMQTYREGIDTLTGIIVKLRGKPQPDPTDVLPDPELNVFWLINGSVRGSASWIPPYVPPDNWTNKFFSFPHWDAHIQGLSLAQLQTLEVIVQVQSRVPDFTLVLVEVDTLEVEITYDIPAPIVATPDEYQGNLSGKTFTRTTNDIVRPTLETLSLVPKTAELIRHNIVYPDPIFALLNTTSQVLATGLYPGKVAVTLTGTTTPLGQLRDPAIETLSFAGKVPSFVHTTNNFVTAQRGRLYLAGQHSGNADTALPGRHRLDLVGQTIVLDRSWTVSPTATSLALSGQAPLLDSGYLVSKATLILTGGNFEAVDSFDRIAIAAATLTGQVPTFYTSLKLFLRGQAASLDVAMPVPGTALALSGEEPIVRSAKPPVGTMQLIGKGLVMTFSTVLVPGDHSVMSLSSRYDIEHIATPTDEIEL